MNRVLTSAWWQTSVCLVWLLIASLAYPGASRIQNELQAAVELQGSESFAVDHQLRDRFKSPFTKIALLRVSGIPSPQTASGSSALAQIVAAVKPVSGVSGVLSYLDRDDGLFIGQDASSILVIGLSPAQAASQSLMADLESATRRLQGQMSPEFPGVSFGWTGEASVNADMRRLSAASTRAAELQVFPIALLLMLLAFRSAIVAMLPLLCGVLTILVSMGVLAAINQYWTTSLIVVSIISMVGLGLSIDYALLLVSRCRENLKAGLNLPLAVIAATVSGGRTLLVSGSAVCVGFGAMLCVPIDEVRSVGTGGVLVTAVSVLVALTLLPILLIWLGPKLVTARVASGAARASEDYWRRWATWVTRRPLRVLIITSVPLLLLAAQAWNLRSDLPRGRWLPESATSVRNLHEIDAAARGNFGQIVNLILDLPAGMSINDEAGWRAASRVARYYSRDPRIQHVWAVTTLSIKPLGGPEIMSQIPEAARASLVTPDGSAALLQLLPKKELAPTDAASLVREIRATNPQKTTGVEGARIQVGGVPAVNVDYEQAIKKSLGLMGGIVICATLLVLTITFRSILIPLKAVALNLLSVAGSLGAVALMFQSNVGAHLLGLPRPLDGGFPIVPVLVFGIVFGLSMDYEIFLVARIAEGREAGLSDSAALVESIASMGRVITFAAAIMITVFTGFIFGEFVLIKILGFALAVAVLLDATVIRLAVGPALFQLAGRWNWWPGDQRRCL